MTGRGRGGRGASFTTSGRGTGRGSLTTAGRGTKTIPEKTIGPPPNHVTTMQANSTPTPMQIQQAPPPIQPPSVMLPSTASTIGRGAGRGSVSTPTSKAGRGRGVTTPSSTQSMSSVPMAPSTPTGRGRGTGRGTTMSSGQTPPPTQFGRGTTPTATSYQASYTAAAPKPPQKVSFGFRTDDNWLPQQMERHKVSTAVANAFMDIDEDNMETDMEAQSFALSVLATSEPAAPVIKQEKETITPKLLTPFSRKKRKLFDSFSTCSAPSASASVSVPASSLPVSSYAISSSNSTYQPLATSMTTTSTTPYSSVSTVPSMATVARGIGVGVGVGSASFSSFSSSSSSSLSSSSAPISMSMSMSMSMSGASAVGSSYLVPSASTLPSSSSSSSSSLLSSMPLSMSSTPLPTPSGAGTSATLFPHTSSQQLLSVGPTSGTAITTPTAYPPSTINNNNNNNTTLLIDPTTGVPVAASTVSGERLPASSSIRPDRSIFEDLQEWLEKESNERLSVLGKRKSDTSAFPYLSTLQDETLKSLTVKKEVKTPPVEFTSAAKSPMDALTDLKPTLVLNLFVRGFSVNEHDAPCRPYDRTARDFLHAIDSGRIPAELIEDLPCAYYDGCVVVEIRDFRFIGPATTVPTVTPNPVAAMSTAKKGTGKKAVTTPSLISTGASSITVSPPPVTLMPTARRVLLRPSAVSLERDLWQIKVVFKDAMDEDALIKIEQKILHATKSVCLDPNPDVCRVSNVIHYNTKKYGSPKLPPAQVIGSKSIPPLSFATIEQSDVYKFAIWDPAAPLAKTTKARGKAADMMDTAFQSNAMPTTVSTADPHALAAVNSSSGLQSGMLPSAMNKHNALQHEPTPMDLSYANQTAASAYQDGVKRVPPQHLTPTSTTAATSMYTAGSYPNPVANVGMTLPNGAAQVPAPAAPVAPPPKPKLPLNWPWTYPFEKDPNPNPEKVEALSKKLFKFATVAMARSKTPSVDFLPNNVMKDVHMNSATRGIGSSRFEPPPVSFPPMAYPALKIVQDSFEIVFNGPPYDRESKDVVQLMMKRVDTDEYTVCIRFLTRHKDDERDPAAKGELKLLNEDMIRLHDPGDVISFVNQFKKSFVSSPDMKLSYDSSNIPVSGLDTKQMKVENITGVKMVSAASHMSTSARSMSSTAHQQVAAHMYTQANPAIASTGPMGPSSTQTYRTHSQPPTAPVPIDQMSSLASHQVVHPTLARQPSPPLTARNVQVPRQMSTNVPLPSGHQAPYVTAGPASHGVSYTNASNANMSMGGNVQQSYMTNSGPTSSYSMPMPGGGQSHPLGSSAGSVPPSYSVTLQSIPSSASTMYPMQPMQPSTPGTPSMSSRTGTYSTPAGYHSNFAAPATPSTPVAHPMTPSQHGYMNTGHPFVPISPAAPPQSPPVQTMFPPQSPSVMTPATPSYVSYVQSPHLNMLPPSSPSLANTNYAAAGLPSSMYAATAQGHPGSTGGGPLTPSQVTVGKRT